MKLSNLSPQAIEKIKSYRWDRIIEKHEGPENWNSVLKYYNPEFMVVNGYHVLLPVDKEHHPNITILRCIVGDNGQTLTLFLKNTTYVDNPDEEIFFARYRYIIEFDGDRWGNCFNKREVFNLWEDSKQILLEFPGFDKVKCLRS